MDFLKICFLVFSKKVTVAPTFQRTFWYQNVRLTLGNILNGVPRCIYAITLSDFVKKLTWKLTKLEFFEKRHLAVKFMFKKCSRIWYWVNMDGFWLTNLTTRWRFSKISNFVNFQVDFLTKSLKVMSHAQLGTPFKMLLRVRETYW